MASAYITAGLLGLPFLIGMASLSDTRREGGQEVQNHSYWEWVLVGFSISFGILILWYIFTLVKYREAKRYFLKKIGKTGDESVSEKMENRFDYYWKSTIFAPAWLLESIIFPQSSWNFAFSFIFQFYFLGYCVYYSARHFEASNPVAIATGVCFGVFILFLVSAFYFFLARAPTLKDAESTYNVLRGRSADSGYDVTDAVADDLDADDL